MRMVLDAYLTSNVVRVKPDTHLNNMQIDQLESVGLIEKAPNTNMNCFVTTEMGNAFVKILCDTPIPVRAKVWQDTRTEKLYHPYGLIGPKTVV